ncbi:MFS transporter [Salinispora vitiensis]|uniref:MFS transporter n=1 Tax=Salinispora vitiensis TaxID=999544 RepID=UPI0004B68C21|nr:MFS transporter [Salinispora vitiensis]
MMGAVIRDFALFRDHRFRLLFGARTVSVLGSAFGPVALTFGVLELPGATPTTLTIVIGTQSVAQIAFMLLGGVIGDRVPRNRLIAVTDVVSAAAFAALAAMLLTGWAPVAALAACAAVIGFCSALFLPALTGIVPSVVPSDLLQTGNGLLRLGTNGARVLGLALAGAVVALVGPGWALLVNAGGFTVSALLMVLLRLSPTPVRAGASVLRELREGWSAFSSRQWLWVIVLQFSVVGAVLQASFGVLGPVVAKAELGGAPAWSAVLAANALGMFLGIAVSIRIRPRRPLLVATLTVFTIALPILLLGAGAPLAAVIVGALLLGIGFDIFGVLFETTMQREVPADTLSRVSAYDAFGSFALAPLALLGCGALIIVATAAALFSPQVRRLETPGRTPDPPTGDHLPVRPADPAVAGDSGLDQHSSRAEHGGGHICRAARRRLTQCVCCSCSRPATGPSFRTCRWPRRCAARATRC